MKHWRLILLFGDLLFVLLAHYLSLLIRLPDFATYIPQDILSPLRIYTGWSVLSITSVFLAFYFSELYRIQTNLYRSRLVFRLIIALSFAALLVSVVSFWIPHYKPFRGALLIKLFFLLAFMYIWRRQFFRFIYPKLPKQKVLLVGAGRMGRTMLETFRHHSDSLYEPVGFIDDNAELIGTKIKDLPVLCSSAELLSMARKMGVTQIVVSIAGRPNKALIENLMVCKTGGCNVSDATPVYMELTGRVPILHVDDYWFIFGPNFSLVSNRVIIVFQRIFDIAVSLIGLILASIPMLFVTIAIKLSSPGPILFRQKRVGLFERSYTILKFRSMVQNAELNTGPVWSTPGDNRVTRLGRMLRRTRLDELPQLYNVLKGEMSFIGPRPERPEFVENLKKGIPYYSLRFLVKPGLTGWAQVNYRYGASENDALIKLQYDLYYLQEMSWTVNAIILLRTVQTVLFKQGS